MTEPEQQKELSAADKLKAHVREFGVTSLVEHWIDSMGDGAQQLLDKIKGNKPETKAAAATAPKEE